MLMSTNWRRILNLVPFRRHAIIKVDGDDISPADNINSTFLLGNVGKALNKCCLKWLSKSLLFIWKERSLDHYEILSFRIKGEILRENMFFMLAFNELWEELFLLKKHFYLDVWLNL